MHALRPGIYCIAAGGLDISPTMIGLIDCNNFFVSCERVFHPRLIGRPVVVMSNGDGCAVAMSNEAKALGITRGVPIYQIRDIIRRHNVITVHGDHRLYGDLSARVMSTIEELVPDIEIYSVDECFIHFPPGTIEQTEQLAREIVKRVRRNVGIPTSLGIAPTKTLAKIAASFAKKYPAYRAVCVMDTDEKRRKALALTDIRSVWGIGRRLTPRLQQVGIERAIDLADFSEARVTTLLNVTGRRTWLELNGHPCIEREAEPEHKQICSSRSFTPALETIEQLHEAVSSFITIASRKLRRQHSCARGVTVFLRTNHFRTDQPQYNRSTFVTLEEATADLMTLTKAAISGIDAIFRRGYMYRKIGVIITDIIPDSAAQPSLFTSPEDRERRKRLMRLLDTLNANPRTPDSLKVATCPLRRPPAPAPSATEPAFSLFLSGRNLSAPD